MKFAEKYVYLKNIYNLGESQITFFKSLLNLTGVVIILTFVKLYFPLLSDFALVVAPFVVACYIAVSFLLGKGLDKKFKIVQAERTFSNSRDPAIIDIQDRLRRIELKMK